MGCDYYLCTKIIGDFEDEHNNVHEFDVIIETDKEKQWMNYYDSDNESFDQALNRRMEAEKELTHLYKDGEWLIKIEKKSSIMK